MEKWIEGLRRILDELRRKIVLEQEKERLGRTDEFL
jgi:hypothetical protein